MTFDETKTWRAAEHRRIEEIVDRFLGHSYSLDYNELPEAIEQLLKRTPPPQ